MFLRKIISVLVVIMLFAISSCCTVKPTEASVETSEETIEETTEETIEETIEEMTGESEEITEETTEEMTEVPEPAEKYFTYEVKYQEVYSNVKIITDKSVPGNFRVTLTKDLPPSFFEKAGCPDAQTCLLEVIQETLGYIEGNKRLLLRDTQRGLLKFGEIDTSKPVELVFLAVRDEEYGKIYLPPWDGSSIPLLSFTFVRRLDGGLRVLIYAKDWEVSTEPEAQYVIPTASLEHIVCILTSSPELLGVGELPMTEEKCPPFLKKVHQHENDLLPIGILRVDFD